MKTTTKSWHERETWRPLRESGEKAEIVKALTRTLEATNSLFQPVNMYYEKVILEISGSKWKSCFMEMLTCVCEMSWIWKYSSFFRNISFADTQAQLLGI